jgi:hypothetical protein
VQFAGNPDPAAIVIAAENISGNRAIMSFSSSFAAREVAEN